MLYLLHLYGTKKYRNEQCAGQDSEKEGRSDTGAVLIKFEDHKKGVQEHGKVQKLHMLPDGFADRCKKAYNAVMFTPVIYEMGKRSGKEDKKDSDDRINFQLFHAVTSLPVLLEVYADERFVYIRGCTAKIRPAGIHAKKMPERILTLLFGKRRMIDNIFCTCRTYFPRREEGDQ